MFAVIAAGVVMLMLDRDPVLFRSNRRVADRAGRLLRRGVLIRCPQNNLKRNGRGGAADHDALVILNTRASGSVYRSSPSRSFKNISVEGVATPRPSS